MSAQIVVGMGFGDEGKGTVTDSLALKTLEETGRAPLVVRFSGGPQAAHNVIDENGFHHTFSQFGSGTLRSSPTLLLSSVLVNPLRLYNESLPLSEFLGRESLKLVSIHEDAPLVTRIHVALNQARERARGDARHGSTGSGVGEAERFRLLERLRHPTVGDLRSEETLRNKLRVLHAWASNEVEGFSCSLDDTVEELVAFAADDHLSYVSDAQARTLVNGSPEVIFEGSQGVLLDEWAGFHPHTTWSTLTPEKALATIDSNVHGEPQVVGVTRTYTTRHGAGPFPSEDGSLQLNEVHNGFGEFQGAWRDGLLDLQLFGYAAQVLRPDTLAITHMDIEQDTVAAFYGEPLDFSANLAHSRDKDWQEDFTRKLQDASPVVRSVESNVEVVRLLETVAGVPATVFSYGPSSDAKVHL